MVNNAFCCAPSSRPRSPFGLVLFFYDFLMTTGSACFLFTYLCIFLLLVKNKFYIICFKRCQLSFSTHPDKLLEAAVPLHVDKILWHKTIKYSEILFFEPYNCFRHSQVDIGRPRLLFKNSSTERTRLLRFKHFCRCQMRGRGRTF